MEICWVLGWGGRACSCRGRPGYLQRQAAIVSASICEAALLLIVVYVVLRLCMSVVADTVVLAV